MKSTLIFALIACVGLVACGQKTSETKPTQQAVSAVVQLSPVIKEESYAQREKAEKEKRDTASKKIEETVTAQIQKMASVKIATSAESKEFADLIGDHTYLGAVMAGSFYKLAKSAETGKECTFCYASNEDEQIKRLASEALVWVQQNPTLVEKIWDGALPYLRTKSELVTAAREVKGILKVPYTEKGFNTLLICIGGEIVGDELKKMCSKEAAKFGIIYTEGEQGRESSYDSYDRNAVWVIKFLHRRHLNGSDKFAQWSQKLMLKLAN